MTHYFQTLLADCFAASGIDRETAEKAAKIAVHVDDATERVTQDRSNSWEMDARILELRGQGLTCVAIALRLSICKRLVFKAVRRHQRARRAALRCVGVGSEQRRA